MIRSVEAPLAKEVNEDAFQGCMSLEKANFPEVTSIDKYAFFWCELLEEANFPKVEP